MEGKMNRDKGPLISIIVPIYNAQPYLRRCLDSIRNQSYRELQVLLVDDGSTDQSGRIAEEYAKRDRRFTVIHKSNAGLVRARKTGVQAAAGEYIGYVDADDWIEPKMYETLLELVVCNRADVVASGRFEESESGARVCGVRIRAGLYEGESREALYRRMLIDRDNHFGVYPTVWDKLFRAQLLVRNQLQVPDEIAMWEDVACTYPLLLEAKRIYISPECFYHYRQHPSSMTQVFDRDLYRRILVIKDYLDRRFTESGYGALMKQQLGDFCKHMFEHAIYREFSVDVFGRGGEYLFPFARIERGSRIVLYGFGRIGRDFYEQLRRCGYLAEIYVMDSFVRKGPGEDYMDVEYIYSPQELGGLVYDYIVIAIGDRDAAWQVRESLMDRGINEKHIVWEID